MEENRPNPAQPTAVPAARAEAPASGSSLLKALLKWALLLIGLALTAIPGLLSAVEARLSVRQEVFVFWGQFFSLVPGLPGKYLRKCYYFLTLQSCTLDWEIGFLSHFTDRRVEVGRRVYIGAAASIATAVLGEGSLIGSHVSILSGKNQHQFGPDGRLTSFDPTAAQQVRIGAETWIGEGAILMADIGSRCIIAAGSVVSTAVPDNCTVAGNPARFVGKTGPWPDGNQSSST